MNIDTENEKKIVSNIYAYHEFIVDLMIECRTLKATACIKFKRLEARLCLTQKHNGMWFLEKGQWMLDQLT